MTLEDRIRNTGEHFLGSFEPNPELPEQISERITLRMRQRRQRAAWGLSAGAVAVVGGLMVANLERGRPAPLEFSSEQTELSVPGTVGNSSASAFTAAPSTLPAPAALDPVQPDPESVPPIGVEDPGTAAEPPAPAVPLLLTVSAATAMVQSVDLATGRTDDRPGMPIPEPAARTSTSASGLRYELSAVELDDCGQSRLNVVDPNGALVPGLPEFVQDLLLSDDGATGALQYTDCTSSTGAAGDATIAMFQADAPGIGAAPMDLPGFPVDFGADGRLVAVPVDDHRLSVIDIDTGETLWTTPDNCTALTGDHGSGILIGDAGFAAVAWCDGQPSLWAGRIPDVRAMTDLGCGDASAVSLDVFDPDQADPATNWFAVHDSKMGSAWVVGDNTVSPPIAVGDRVWWERPAA